ncbi:MAG: polysaccharide biosynthesis/export family protein, partial [Planctomycetes bacterium]|nr:polysaccharide biosynthesis/export family protein [Planctomycetota bacterium]
MAGRLLQAAVWLGVSGLGGCATTGQVSVRDLPAQYEAQSVRPVKALDFAKLARPSEQQRHIQSGDLLEVTCSDLLAESKKETIPVRVDPDGAITLPLLPGTLRLDSLTCGEAEQTIETAYRTANLVRQPHVSIKTLEFSNKKIYVIGAVKKPGMYELRPDECNPLRAILAAEGVTEDAGSVVEIRRTGRPSSPPPPAPAPSNILVTGASIPTGQGQANPAGSLTGDNDVIRFDLADQGLNVRPDQLVLNNGDVVSVEERKKQPFFVTGSVNQPGQFPTPADREIHVLEAIGMAGGVNTLSQPTLALITRRLEGKPPVVLRVDLDRAARYPKE